MGLVQNGFNIFVTDPETGLVMVLLSFKTRPTLGGGGGGGGCVIVGTAHCPFKSVLK